MMLQGPSHHLAKITRSILFYSHSRSTQFCDRTPPPKYPPQNMCYKECPAKQCLAEVCCCDDTDDMIKLLCIYTICGCGRQIPPARLEGITVGHRHHFPAPRGDAHPNLFPAANPQGSQPGPKAPMSYRAGGPPRSSDRPHSSRPFTLGSGETRYSAGRDDGGQSGRESRSNSHR